MKSAKYKSRAANKKVLGTIGGAVIGGVVGNKVYSENEDSSIADYYTNVTPIADRARERFRAMKNPPTIILSESKVKDIQRGRKIHKHRKSIGTAVGASTGAIISSILTKAQYSEYKTLRSKSKRSTSEESRLKQLKKIIIAARLGGTIAGGAVGYKLAK